MNETFLYSVRCTFIAAICSMYPYFHADNRIPRLRYEPHIGKIFFREEARTFTNSLKKKVKKSNPCNVSVSLKSYKDVYLTTAESSLLTSPFLSAFQIFPSVLELRR